MVCLFKPSLLVETCLLICKNKLACIDAVQQGYMEVQPVTLILLIQLIFCLKQT